jgi:coenzyme F420-reducing hydrogenase delta subunit
MGKLSHVDLLFVTSMAVFLLFNCGNVIAQTQQGHVHNMSHSVMPFDMAKTVHVFAMTESGGVQRVIVKDRSYADQVMLIQKHLSEEASRFQHGDYSDPAKLHGENMPGLKELQLGAQRVKVSYADLADGAKITFETTDPHLLTAIHRWFGAQLSEHGTDARAE